MRWLNVGGVWTLTVRRGFVTVRIVPTDRGHMVRVNGVEIKRYPETLAEAKDLGVRAVRKLLREASDIIGGTH